MLQSYKRITCTHLVYSYCNKFINNLPLPTELLGVKKKKEQKKNNQNTNLCNENPCISYSKLSLFWNHNPGSAHANPDVDGFKIIAQHNTAATLIHLPTLILQALIPVSILRI